MVSLVSFPADPTSPTTLKTTTIQNSMFSKRGRPRSSRSVSFSTPSSPASIGGGSHHSSVSSRDTVPTTNKHITTSPLGKHKLSATTTTTIPPDTPYPVSYPPLNAGYNPYYNTPSTATTTTTTTTPYTPYFLPSSAIANYMMMDPNHHQYYPHIHPQNLQRKKRRQVAGDMVAGFFRGGGGSGDSVGNGHADDVAAAGGAPPDTPHTNSTMPHHHAAGVAAVAGGGTGGGAGANATKKSTAKPRPAIQVPPRGIGPVFEPNHHDVLCGRGGRINAHAGNVQFRELVAAKKAHYLAPSTKKLEKAHIAAQIVAEIRHYEPGGRFLKEDPDGTWFDIGDAKAIKKVGQALREDAPEVRDGITTKPRDGAHSSEDEASPAPSPSGGGENSASSTTSKAIAVSGRAGKVLPATNMTSDHEMSTEYRPIAVQELPQENHHHHHHHHQGDYTVIPPPLAAQSSAATSMASKINIGMRGMMPKKPAAVRFGTSGGGGGVGGNPHHHHHHQPAVSGAAAQVMRQNALHDDNPIVMQDHAFGRVFHVPATIHGGVGGSGTTNNDRESSIISGMSGPTVLSGMSGISALTDPQSSLSANFRDNNDLLQTFAGSGQHQQQQYSHYHQYAQRRGVAAHHHHPQYQQQQQQQHQAQQPQQNYNNTYDTIRHSQLQQLREQWAAGQQRNTSIGTMETPRSEQQIRTSDTGVTVATTTGGGMGTLQRSISWTDLGSAFENMSWGDGNSLIDSQQQHQQQQQQQASPQQQHHHQQQPNSPLPGEYAGSALSGRSVSSFATLRTLEDDPNNLILPPLQPEQMLEGRTTSSSSRSRSGGGGGYYQQPRSRFYSGGGGGASIKDGGASVASMMSINSGNVSLGSARSIMSDISENIAALDLAEPSMRLLDQFGANL